MLINFPFPLIDTCSAVLESFLSKALSRSPLQTKSTTTSIFDAKKEPRISIAGYVARFRKFADCSESCYISALVYLDRLIQCTSYEITPLNVHRLYLATMVLSIKFNEDRYYDNEYYAALGGVDSDELRALEAEMMRLLDFKLFISYSKFRDYLTAMERYYRHCLLDCRRPSDSESDSSGD